MRGWSAPAMLAVVLSWSMMSPPATAEGPVEIRGRVVGPDGKPVAGAVARAPWLGPTATAPPEAACDPDGRFVLPLPDTTRSYRALSGPGGMMPWVVATAPGYGPGWVAGFLRPGAPATRVIRLVRDGPPIEGRLVDQAGRPVAGVTVRVHRLWYVGEPGRFYDEAGGLSGALQRARDQGVRRDWLGPDLKPLPMPFTEATTDADGRFRLTGIGHDRVAELTAIGPTIATSPIYVQCFEGQEVRAVDQDSRTREIVFHAPRFEQVVEPGRSIEGVIQDRDTGRPIGGMQVFGSVLEGKSSWQVPGIEVTSDASGHYRIMGLHRGSECELLLEANEGVPYFRALFKVPADPPGTGPITFDIVLKRGILVRGKVTEKGTGRPAAGMVYTVAFADNPHIRERRDLALVGRSIALIHEDGSYQAVALPGKGIVTALVDLGRYRFDRSNPRTFKTLPIEISTDRVHAWSMVDLDPAKPEATVNLEIDPGRSLTIKAVDADGRPVAGARAEGLGPIWRGAVEQEGATMEVHGLALGEARRVTIAHEGRGLAGWVDLRGDESGPVTVRLLPQGRIVGRMVDEESRPRAGLSLQGAIDHDAPPIAGRSRLPEDVTVGPDGRFVIDALVPGLRYEATVEEIPGQPVTVFRDALVNSGETRDLGDIEIPARR